jgi:tRNA-splicing ligase RtcB
MSEYNVILGNRNPIKMWTKGLEDAPEPKALRQITNIANMPFIHKHVAVVPDYHLGKGATIGTVIATKGAVIPAAVGVDIGCGLNAIKTDLNAKDLPDDLHRLRSMIEAAIPHGRTNHGQRGDRGAWGVTPKEVQYQWDTHLAEGYARIIERHPNINKKRGLEAQNTHQHLMSLGGGNHFLELCLDENESVWITVHSGSRGIGNRIGTAFIEKAKEEMAKYFIELADPDLSYLVKQSSLYDDYVFAVSWAQKFAHINRNLMLDAMLKQLALFVGKPLIAQQQVISCHHNYINMENHFGQNVLVTRKGAVSAQEGEWGIIPGSMGTSTFIVKGKGNPESFCSCSHGAGRRLARGEAFRTITLEQHAKAMEGIECRLDAEILDESPACYKDINKVMAAQESLVDIVHTLRQIVNVKG